LRKPPLEVAVREVETLGGDEEPVSSPSDSFHVANTPNGRDPLVGRLQQAGPARIVLEASGGLERPVVAALGAADLPVVVMKTICLETLNVKGMQRREARAAPVQNRSLSRSIADTGWSTLVQYIEYFATSNTKPNGPGAPWSRLTDGFPPRSGAPPADTSGRRNRCRFGAGNVRSAPRVMIGM